MPTFPLTCPRCGGTNFRELECGYDTYEDDRTWMADICTACGLYYSGWLDMWLTDCESWGEEDTAKEFRP